MNDNITCRDLDCDNLDQVAIVHLQAFPNSALTKLGKEAVRRYYEWQMIGPHDMVAIGMFEGTELLGFCFGGKFRGALSGYLKRNRVFLTRRVLTNPQLIIDSLLRQRLQFALSYLFRPLFPKQSSPRTVTQSNTGSSSFSILSIAVAPQYQGKGVASVLMKNCENIAFDRGANLMKLTVHPANERAVHFYEKMGWQKDIFDDAWGGHMSKILKSSDINP